MNPLFSILFSICVSQVPLKETVAPFGTLDYGYETVYETYGFLSGVTYDAMGIVLCDYRGNRLIRLSDSGDVETIFGGIGSPVDVECVDGEYWFLLNNPPALMSWNPTTQRRTMLAYDFDEDANLTAFALASRDLVYIVDYRGLVYRIDLNSGTKTIAFENFDNPADVAVLPGGGIVVTEQVGSDAGEGRVRFFLPNGQEKIHELTDPTGLAVGPNGEVYVTVFFTETIDRNPPDSPELYPDSDESGKDVYQRRVGGVVRFDSWDSEPEIVAIGLSGPTSLTLLPDGRIVAIEQAVNSIVSINADGSIETLFIGTMQPLAVKAFPDGTVAYLTTDYLNDYLDFLIRDSKQNVWTFSRKEGNSPKIELGGDGLLYAYDPVFSELLIFQSDGKLLQSYVVYFESDAIPRLMADPSGGVALVFQSREMLFVQKANRHSLDDVVEYKGDYSSLIYFDEEGNIRDASAQNPVPDGVFSNTNVAVDSNGDVWYVDANGDVYRVSNDRTERVAENLGNVKDIYLDGDGGANVTTEEGRVIHLYPSTSIPCWILY